MLVSAIMPTRGRFVHALSAALQFQLQTWPDKELVIADDADMPSFPDGVHYPGFDVQYHRIPRMTIGAKRNLCCARARGEIVIHLDDDDFSAPARFLDQVMRLTESGKAVTGYSAMRFTDGRNWWQYRGGPECALGTSLCYQRDWWKQHPFPTEQIGEDGAFVKVALRARELVVADAGELMHATIHPLNTSPRGNMTGSCWKALEC